MIFDNSQMIADGLAYGGTPTVIDLGMTTPGPGRPLRLFCSGVSLAGVTGLTVTDGATSTAADTCLSVDASSSTLNGGGIEFDLPNDVARYVKVALAGTPSAGTWTCGLIIP